jgi:hypothetical protein
LHNCDEIFEHIYEFINARDVSPEREADIRMHLQMCRKCYTHFEFERRLIEKIRQVGDCPCPSTLKQKINKILEEF